MTLIVVTYLSTIVAVTAVAGDMDACANALPVFTAEFGRHASANGLPVERFEIDCAPVGSVVFAETKA